MRGCALAHACSGALLERARWWLCCPCRAWRCRCKEACYAPFQGWVANGHCTSIAMPETCGVTLGEHTYNVVCCSSLQLVIEAPQMQLHPHRNGVNSQHIM
jgi:hypothetical protein